jgi:hypothetical protein
MRFGIIGDTAGHSGIVSLRQGYRILFQEPEVKR